MGMSQNCKNEMLVLNDNINLPHESSSDLNWIKY